MSTTKLALYNGALQHLGERALASLSENRQPRRELDTAWDGGAMNYCLEAGQWKFAMRSVMLDASPSVDPVFGFSYAFDMPSDHLRLGGVWSDEAFTTPLNDYRQEGAHLYANLETIFVRYVSNDASFGGDLSLWPQRFVEFVKAHLAACIARALTGDDEKEKTAFAKRERYKTEALSNDAMQDPSRKLPAGNWVKARFGGWASREQR